jgi:hypothetical protein
VVLGVGQEATCAMHGGLAAGSVARGAHQHHAAARVAMTAHEHGRHERGSSQQDSHGCDCTCIGDCTATAPVATLPAATTVRVATIAAQSAVEPDARSADAPPPASADRRLPFANGPPATQRS